MYVSPGAAVAKGVEDRVDGAVEAEQEPRHVRGRERDRAPARIWSWKSGMTEPREASTLP